MDRYHRALCLLPRIYRRRRRTARLQRQGRKQGANIVSIGLNCKMSVAFNPLTTTVQGNGTSSFTEARNLNGCTATWTVLTRTETSPTISTRSSFAASFNPTTRSLSRTLMTQLLIAYSWHIQQTPDPCHQQANFIPRRSAKKRGACVSG